MIEDLGELIAIARSAEDAYMDWARITPDGTDIGNPERFYAPGTGDALFRNVCAHVQQLVEIANRLQETAITEGIEHTSLNNRQLANAIGVSHPKIGRRRSQLTGESRPD